MNKRLITTAATVVLFLGTVALPPAIANAATTSQPTASHEKLKTALKQLDLTVAQQSKIKAILVEARTEKQIAKTTAQTTGAKTTGTTTHGGSKGTISKIMAVLTPAQKTKLKELMKSGK